MKDNSEDELNDIFPALSRYKENHNIANLQQLCVETVEFCNSIYASTRNNDERAVYARIIGKIIK